ncbi:MAG: 3-oxoacyl-ACP synthase [Proteobacteria bacterium]|nr:MAG: 3-oxoacyl-ACP synthase [Pseudomonadota bacterium]
MYASLKSIGAYAPEKILSNHDLEKMVDTSDEWIVQRTGIKERRIASKDQAASDLGVEAAQIALQRANLDAKDIDAVICATLSPDYLTMPSTAAVISHKLGIHGKAAFDISAACSGFVYLLNLAKPLIEADTYKNVLIVGAEKTSAFVDYTDRGTCILFGDGAGACIIGQTKDKNKSILSVQTGADGRYADLLITPGCGSENPCSKEVLDQKLNFMKMSGNEVFKIAVKTLTQDVIDILEKNNIKPNEVDHFIPHQANLRIIEAVRAKLDFPIEKTIFTIQKYGNTSAASIPMAINEAYEQGRIKPGDLMLLDTFGGGFTWGSALLRFGGEK